jgi:anaerobic nitric oxide reductase transcription regulator
MTFGDAMHAHADLTQLALDLTVGVSTQDRFERLLAVVRRRVNCDAAALLVFREQQFVPLAIDGLFAEVLGRRFQISEHPRLEAIARAGDVVRFPADSELPDPYDGLIPNHSANLHVHACIGLPLIANDRLIGALTIDGFNPHQFDAFSDAELRVISALAAASLNTALLMQQLESQVGEVASGTEVLNRHASQLEIIGQSIQIQSLKQQISAVASTDLSVLITGETGVGKELVAAAIHNQSTRADKPLIYLNCAALPESVAESELFGHVKGAFTGAISHRQGKFELADNGTLFLDEIGELPLGLQAKLLRVLQYGELQRVGSDKSLKVNTRIIAATNRVLHQEAIEGRFRFDLYHRLSVFPIHVPPLREREQDVVILTGFFLERCKGKLGLTNISIAPSAQQLLDSYTWPGNVRELEHAIHRAAVLAKAELKTAYISLSEKHFQLDPVAAQVNAGHYAVNASPQSVTAPVPLVPSHITVSSRVTSLSPEGTVAVGLKEATEAYQRQLIRQTFAEQQQNWAACARALQIDTGNLHRLAKRLGLKA